MVRKTLTAGLLFSLGIATVHADGIPVVQASVMAEKAATGRLDEGIAKPQTDEIPAVPVSVLTENVPDYIDKESEPEPKADANTLTVNDSRYLQMKPGVNEIVPIAVNHLNRLVTPFGNPHVNTTSNATTTIRDNVVYVATDSETPVTLFITQQGSEVQALSLTLWPQRIPPREIFIQMESGVGMPGMFANTEAEQWETSQPYVDTLRSLLRHVALGKTPQGYSLHDLKPGYGYPSCIQPGMSFDFDQGQMLIGHNLTVKIGVAQNVSGQPIEFVEAACGDWDVAAVAAWPRNVLGPDENTEIYVVTKVGQKAQPNRKRPSLLGGQP